MKLVISEQAKVKQFEIIFKFLKNISLDVNLIFSDDGLYTQGMCSSHITLFECNLNKSWFKTYEKEEEEDLMVGVNCESFFKALNCLENTQIITIETEGTDSIKLYFTGEKTITKEFNLPLMNIDTELMEIPDVEYSADIIMLSDQLDHLINQLCDFGQVVNIKCDEQDIQLETLGEMGNMNIKIKEDDIIEYALEESEEDDKEFCNVLSISYSLEFLKNICLFAKLNKQVKLHMSSEYPLKLQYDLDDWTDGDLENDNVEEDNEITNYIRFFVAPKLED